MLSKSFVNMARREKVAGAVKVFYVLILFLIFFRFFAVVQIETYLKEGVLIEVGEVPCQNGVPAPKITICAEKAETESVWDETGNPYLPAGRSEDCNHAENVTKCIIEPFYNVKDLIRNLNSFDRVTTAITTKWYGNCVSLESNVNLDSIVNSAKLHLNLDVTSNMTYFVFLYDPKYFFISVNRRANSGLKLRLHNKGGTTTTATRYYKLDIIQHEKLNLNRRPCVENENFNFGDCLRGYIETAVQCRLPWHQEILENGVRQTCTAFRDFQLHQEFYTWGLNRELQDIVDMTSCHPPCKYKEIKQVGSYTDIPKDKVDPTISTIATTVISRNLRTETEKLSLPFVTLIANLGGTLGLFLGFSLMMVWDWIIIAYRYILSVCC